MPLDLRKKPVPPAAPAVTTQQSTIDREFPIPAPGMPPLPTGKLILTEHTKKFLKGLGWKEGDPIPGDMAKHIAQLQKQAKVEAENTAGLSPVPLNTPPAVPKKTVDIKDLSPEHQAELKASLEEAKQQMAVIHAQEAHDKAIRAQQIEGAHPSVNEAIRTAAEAIQQPEVVLIKEPIKTPESAPAEPAAPADELPAATAEFHICPRCLFDLRSQMYAEPTETDKRTFVMAELGQQRFRREVDLFDGRVRVIFRSPTTKEANLALTQCRYDVLQERVMGQDEWYSKLADYRLAMAVEKLIIDGTVAFDLPPLDEITYDPPEPGKPPATALPALLEHVYTQVLPQDTMRRAIGKQHRYFDTLLNTLEARSVEPSFWKGIESPS